MTGVTISITISDKAVSQAFQKLERAMADTTPVMDAIGTGLVGSTHQRFATSTDPDGQAWSALVPAYAEGKRNSRILTESGLLRDSIHSKAQRNEVRVGPHKVYAAIHQFGGTIKPKKGSHLRFRMGDRLIKAESVTIPARPYLGISSADETMIAETVFGFLSRLSGR